MIINIRGANGSGKTTVAKAFLRPEDGLTEVELCANPVPKKQPAFVMGTINAAKDTTIVGPYKTACGGMDALPNFEVCRIAIRSAAKLSRNVICEGVLASTVFGSWADFAIAMNMTTVFAFAYLQTPVEECLRRIKIRNGGKEIKEELVHGKIKAVAATRVRAIEAGFTVYDLPLELPEQAVAKILAGEGEEYLANRRHADAK